VDIEDALLGNSEYSVRIMGLISFGDGRISTHADPTSTRRVQN